MENVHAQLKKGDTNKRHGSCGKNMLAYFESNNIHMVGSENVKPKTAKDIVDIISSKDWYNNNKPNKQKIIHWIMYAMYRKGNNS